MRDTPRTNDWLNGRLPSTWMEEGLIDFSRQLERELIELQHQHGIVKAILAKVEDERNELLKKVFPPCEHRHLIGMVSNERSEFSCADCGKKM